MKNTIKKIVCFVSAGLAAAAALTGCGGKKAFDASKNISVVAREDGSGTKSAFMEIIGLKGKADVSGVIIATGTAGVLAEVRSNPLAVAYESLGYVTDDVKMLKVDGVEPTVDNIKNGTYRIARPLNVVYQEKTVADGVCKAYLEFLQSADAQKIITEKGYVSTNDGAQEYKIQSGLTGKIGISGSTSLQPLMIELAKKFESLQSGVTVSVSGGGSGTGYKNAKEGVSGFGMISETFNSEKADNCTSYEVAKDGIAVIVNKSNTNDNIALDTLKSIYNCEAGDSAVTKWDQVSK